MVIGNIKPDQIADISADAIDGVEKRIPAFFRKALIYGICEQVDSLENKRYWRDLFLQELEIKKDRDESKKGKMIRTGHDATLLNARKYTY